MAFKKAAAVQGEGPLGITCKGQAGTGSALICHGQQLQNKLCQGIALERRAKSGSQRGSLQARLPWSCPGIPKLCCPWPQTLGRLGGEVSDKEEEKQLCFPSSVSLFLKNPALAAHRMERRQISNKNPPPRTPCGPDSSDSARLGAREKGHGCIYSPTLVQPPPKPWNTPGQLSLQNVTLGTATLASNVVLFPHLQAMPAFQGSQGACAQPWVRATSTTQPLHWAVALHHPPQGWAKETCCTS